MYKDGELMKKTVDLLSDSEWTLYESLEGPDCGDRGDQGGGDPDR